MYTHGSPVVRSLAVPAVHATDTPAGSAKITLEGLEYWRTRLGRDVEALARDISESEALAEKWCLQKEGIADVGLHELKELKAKKVSRPPVTGSLYVHMVSHPPHLRLRVPPTRRRETLMRARRQSRAYCVTWEAAPHRVPLLEGARALLSSLFHAVWAIQRVASSSQLSTHPHPLSIKAGRERVRCLGASHEILPFLPTHRIPPSGSSSDRSASPGTSHEIVPTHDCHHHTWASPVGFVWPRLTEAQVPTPHVFCMTHEAGAWARGGTRLQQCYRIDLCDSRTDFTLFLEFCELLSLKCRLSGKCLASREVHA